MIRFIISMVLGFAFVVSPPVLRLSGAPPVAAERASGRNASLSAAIQNTLKNNPEILAAREKISASQATLKSEENQRLPGIALDASARESGSEDALAYVRVTQPLWVGGRIDNAVEKARRELDESKARLLMVQRELMENTAAAYANATGLKQRLGAARLNIHEHERLLDLISRRKKGKIASDADVQLARSRYAMALMTAKDLEGQIQVALNDLYALTLTPMEQFEPVSRDLLSLPGHARVEAQVADGSPRLRAAGLAIDIARIDRLISRAEFYPRIFGRLDQDLYDKEGTSRQHRDTSLALVVQGSLDGAGFRTLEQVRAAQARVRAARMAFDAEKNDVNRTTRSLLADRDTIQQLVDLNTSLVKTTGQTLVSYTRQHEAGRKSWLDLLNVQREHANARLSLAQVNSQYEQVCLRLVIRMGRLDGLRTP